MDRYIYCPVCAAIYEKRTDNCSRCGANINMRCSKHEKAYYTNKALKKHKDETKWLDILISEEIKTSPLYNPEYYVTEEEVDKRIMNWLNEQAAIRKAEEERISQPKCPTCGSFNVKPVSRMRRAAHMYAFGLFSTTARAQFECISCGYKW